MSDPRPCRFCRAKIQMIPGPNGTPIPAQKITQLYISLDGGPLGSVRRGAILSEEGDLYISHFQTCPDAKKASKRKKA